MILLYDLTEVLMFYFFTFLSGVPLWIMIYFDKKDDGAWTGLLGQQFIGWSKFVKEKLK